MGHQIVAQIRKWRHPRFSVCW